MRFGLIALLRQMFQHRGYLRAVGSSYLLMLSLIVVQVAVVPFYLRAFGQYQFGVLMILLSLINFVSIGIGWLSCGALRLLGEYAAKGDEPGFRDAFAWIKAIYVGYGCILAILAGIAAFGFGFRIFTDAPPQDIFAMRMALLLCGLHMIASYSVAADRLALIARKRQSRANMAQLIGVLTFGAGAILWIYAGGNMPGVMGVQIISTLAGGLISKRMLQQELPGLKTGLPKNHGRQILAKLGGRTGAGFFLHGILVLTLQADMILVGWLAGAKAAAEFYLVWKIAEALVLLIRRLPDHMTPYFIHMDVHGEHSRLNKTARTGYLLIACVALLTGILYALFGSHLVAFWVGREQPTSSPAAFALAGGAIFWLGIARLPVVLASARVMLSSLNLAGGFELCGKLAIAVFLFPRFGYLSLLIGINLAHLLGGSYLYFRLLRVSDKREQLDSTR
jgi:O-antigen/teichoic acid export membrane protein